MEKRAMAVREEQWIQTIAAAKQSVSASRDPVLDNVGAGRSRPYFVGSI